MPTINELKQTLAEISVPYLDADIISTGLLNHLDIKGSEVYLELVLPFSLGLAAQGRLQAALESSLLTLPDVNGVHIKITGSTTRHRIPSGVKAVPNIKNIIAIASGKGGVGKSTVTANLAMALQAQGAKVGILDADIYGPSQPLMLGSKAEQHANVRGDQHLVPLQQHGIQSMSMGYLVEQEAAMIWRGPMVSSALQQLLFETKWKALDYLLVDLPPGTGDIQLTLAQKIPLVAAIIVTTPQDLSLLDARRAYHMFRKVNVPVLGVIENMSDYQCPHCGEHSPIFGTGGGARMANQYAIPLIGQIPLTLEIRTHADQGMPQVAAEPEGVLAALHYDMAIKMSVILSREPKDYSGAFPNIVVENTDGN